MSASQLLSELRSAGPLVAPSLLACDFGNVQREVKRLEEAGARIFHLDIMDGRFVPNLSFGLPVVEAIRRATSLPLDVHLMIEQPGKYLERFREAGADLLTIHIEAQPNPTVLLKQIRDLGAGVGLTLNPPTPVATVEPYLDLCDLVLVMSVMPGFGGQEFDPAALDKLRRLDELAGSRLLLSVDGGVNSDTIGSCARAGARLLVAGTAILHHDDYHQRLSDLTNTAKSSMTART